MREASALKKNVFYITAAAVFVTILVYECLTPMLSDDLNYGIQVRAAASVADLFRQEAEQYAGWTGRSVAHIILRFFLYGGSKAVFNVCAASCFTLTVFMMYRLVKRREAYDAVLLAGCSLMLWFFAPSFAETVLWETGACNYLITTTIILVYLRLIQKIMCGEAKAGAMAAVGMLFLGTAAGWCNENTSGGMLLAVLLWLFINKREEGSAFRIPTAVWAGMAGNVIGLAAMVLAPGNRARAMVKDEAHEGLMLLAARFLKVNLAVREAFLIPLLIFAVLLLYLWIVKKDRRSFRDAAVWGIVFAATSYVLVAAPEPQQRALYGAGIFLLTGIAEAVQGAVYGEAGDSPASFTKGAAVLVMAVIMFFGYIENGADLARVRRDTESRYAMIREAAARGEETVYLPLLHQEFENPYTMAYRSDLSTDWDYWVNYAFVEYFGVEQVIGVEWEEWEENYE